MTPSPNSRPYTAYGGALAMWRCRDKEVLIEGPAGTGKTRGVLEKAHFCLSKYDGARALAVRKTRASMTHSVLVTYEDKVLPANSPIKAGASRAQRQSYRYPNGSELVIGGMDNADRIMSTEFDLVLGFEWTEALEDDHEKLTTRLRNGVMPYQQIITDCNPSYPYHWLNQRANTGLMTRILSRHSDNPTVSVTYLNTLALLTGARELRLNKGIWAAQDGLVYDTFDPAIHVLSSLPIGHESWPVARVIDFGYTNPFVCQWWKFDPDNRAYMYREIYMSGRTLREHAPDIIRYSQGENIIATIADPEDAQGRADLDSLGIGSQTADKAIALGIQDVKDRLRVLGDGWPRLFIVRDATVEIDPAMVAAKLPTGTLQEIDGYVWPKAAPAHNDKEVPVDKNNHGMDAMRYLVRWRDSNGEFGI